MPPSLGLLWFGLLKAVATAVLAFAAFSLGPVVWADPPEALRFSGAPQEASDVVALFRATERSVFQEEQEAAQAALLDRFPLGSDSSALTAFLTSTGHGRCQPIALGNGRRGYHCLIRYGSLAASVLGLDRWRLRERVVGVGLARDTEVIESVSVRVPFLGKG